MLRLLFWIAVIAAAVWFWRKFKTLPPVSNGLLSRMRP